tara:strand:+ start:160 stop:1254 length:1095 start_codon:yes stop_codon:yes gene_type:complete
MPYANAEDKKAHNKAYHDERKVSLMIARLQKAQSTKVTQYTYDLIKNEASEEWLNTLTIIGKNQVPENEDKQVVRRGKVKVSPDRVKELIDALDVSDNTKKAYKSKVNVLVALLCDKVKDFTCIYININKKIAILDREYTNSTSYLAFMVKMSNIEEIGRHIPAQNKAILVRKFQSTKHTTDTQAIEKTKERNENTDWNEQYMNLVDHASDDIDDTFNEEVVIHHLYVYGIKDNKDKLQMIPRNYFFNTRVVDNLKQTNKTDNFYIKKSGIILVNDFKTKNKHKPIKYQLSLDDKRYLNKFVGDKEYLFGNISRETMNEKIKKALGVGIDDYRRIMRHRYLQKYSLEYVSEVMRHSPQVGEAYY